MYPFLLSYGPMTALRHRLHLCVAAWLILQVAALSAFVPQDCCATHKAQHEKNHQSMGGHAHAEHGEHHAAPKSPAQGCVMKGTCQGPMSAILAILSNQGVPPSGAFRVAPDDLSSTLAAVIVREHIPSLLAAPDPPPPRA